MNKINFLFDSPRGVMYPKNSDDVLMLSVKNPIVAFN
jgi:hypothetical protein